MSAHQSYNKYKIILTSLRQAFQNFTFLENENSDMTRLKISFSNFLVQRLILQNIYGYPVFYFPKRTV